MIHNYNLTIKSLKSILYRELLINISGGNSGLNLN